MPLGSQAKSITLSVLFGRSITCTHASSVQLHAQAGGEHSHAQAEQAAVPTRANCCVADQLQSQLRVTHSYAKR